MSDGFITIQSWMRERLNLSGNDLIIYAVIYGFSQDGESSFVGSRQYLADWCGCTVRNVQTILNNLVERGLLIKNDREINNIKRCEYSAVVPNFTDEKISPVQKLHGAGEKTSLNNIEDSIKSRSIISFGDNTGSSEDDYDTHGYSPQELRDEFVGSVSKTKKKGPRRLSLYEKCVAKIEEYTDDAILQEMLKKYLQVRLAIKEKPIYGVNQWTAILKKLTETPGDKRKIVQQSIEQGWCSFYPLKDSQQRGTNFSEFGTVSSEQSETTEEERKDALRKRGRRETF